MESAEPSQSQSYSSTVERRDDHGNDGMFHAQNAVSPSLDQADRL